MTSMDPSFQSREMIYGLRQRGAEQIGQAYANTGAIANDAARFIQDLAIKQAESGAKIQAWEMERQVNLRKLQEMQMVDVTEQSRLQTELLRSQVDATKFDLQRKQQAASAMSPEEERWLGQEAAYQKTFGSEMDMARSGIIRDPKTGRRRVGTEQEVDTALSRQMEIEAALGLAKRPLASHLGRDLGALTNSYKAELEQLDMELKDLNPKDEAQAARIAQIKQRKEAILQEMRGSRSGVSGGGAPQQQQSVPELYQSTMQMLHREGQQMGATPLQTMRAALEKAGITDAVKANDRFREIVEHTFRAYMHYHGPDTPPQEAMRVAILNAIADIEEGRPEVMEWMKRQ